MEIQNSEPNQHISREDEGDFAEEAIFRDESNKEDRNQIFHFNPKFLVQRADPISTNKGFTEAETIENVSPFNDGPNAMFLSKKK